MEKEQNTEIEKRAPQRLVTVDNSEFSGYLDTAKFDQMWRVARMFSETQIVPSHYQNKPSDCFVAAQMAIRLGVDPLMFMQNTFIVHGKPGMEAKLIIALINTSGLFEDSLQWRFEGEGAKRKCTAFATKKKNKQLCEASVDWGTVVGEGWDKNPKWKTMTDQMFKYRTATFFSRLHCPECTMGMQTVDELIDVLGDDGEVQPATRKIKSGNVTNNLSAVTPNRKATVSQVIEEPAPKPDPTPEVEQPQGSGLYDDEPQTEPDPTPAELKLAEILDKVEMSTNRAELSGLRMDAKKAGLDRDAMTSIEKAIQCRTLVIG